MVVFRWWLIFPNMAAANCKDKANPALASKGPTCATAAACAPCFNELLALPWEKRKLWANGATIEPPGPAGWKEMTSLVIVANLHNFPADIHCEL